MPSIINLPTFSDDRGKLTVVEKVLPFSIKRVFCIYDVNSERGGHGHHKTKMALIALSGSVRVKCQCPKQDYEFELDSPSKCLLLNPEDWHSMDNFSEHATLLVMASEEFNKDDYFYEKYR